MKIIILHIENNVLGFRIPSTTKIDKLKTELEIYMKDIHANKHQLHVVEYYNGVVADLEDMYGNIKIINYATKRALKHRLMTQFGRV